jgi:hypothetical protein
VGLLSAVVLGACVTPGGRYFAGESESCRDVEEARAFAESHAADLTEKQHAELLVDHAHCLAETPDGGPIEPLLVEAEKHSPEARGHAEAMRAAVAAQEGKVEEAEKHLEKAVELGFSDLELVLTGTEFEPLLKLPALEDELVHLAADEEPVEPRIQQLAVKLGQKPLSVVVSDANPKYALHTFTLWRGRVLESHYDEDNDETTILLEELLIHGHINHGRHTHTERTWSPFGGYQRIQHTHVESDLDEEDEATGRVFGLRMKGFPREVVEASDLEVVGYYVGHTPMVYRGERYDVATLDVVRAVPFDSGAHKGTPVSH